MTRAAASLAVAFLLAAGPVAARQTSPAVEVSADPEGGARVTASVVVAAPPETVWKLLTDCAGARRLYAGVDDCRVLSVAPGGRSDVRHSRVRWLPGLPPVRFTFRNDYEPGREIRFRLVEGDLKRMEGRWRLTVQDGATRVDYDSRVAGRLPAPGGWLRRSLRQDTEAVLTRLKAAAETDARRAPGSG